MALETSVGDVRNALKVYKYTGFTLGFTLSSTLALTQCNIQLAQKVVFALIA